MYLQVSDLSLGYGRRSVVSGVDFTLEVGELLAVVGHNGSGKSTLIRALLGLHRPQAGRIEWQGQRPKMAYLGQGQRLDRRFPMKTLDLVSSGGWDLAGMGGFLGRGRSAAELYQHAMQALERVHLLEASDVPIHALSGGQLQRALFARGIVQDAPLLILDEPFAGIDQNTEADLLQLLVEWKAQGRGIVLVNHDLSSVLNCATNALLLGRGRAEFGEPCTTLTPENLISRGYLSSGQARWVAGMFATGAKHD